MPGERGWEGGGGGIGGIGKRVVEHATAFVAVTPSRGINCTAPSKGPSLLHTLSLRALAGSSGPRGLFGGR